MTKKVTVYGTDSCIHCRHTKEFLEKKKQPYTFIDLSKRENLSHLQKMVNEKTTGIPKICIEDDKKSVLECITGFNEPQLKKMLGEDSF